MTDYNKLPTHMRDGFRRYIEHGIEGGGFINAVLENNLMRAMGKADDFNRVAMFSICDFVYNDAPATCHGSPERVRAWIESGGINGRTIGD